MRRTPTATPNTPPTTANPIRIFPRRSNGGRFVFGEEDGAALIMAMTDAGIRASYNPRYYRKLRTCQFLALALIGFGQVKTCAFALENIVLPRDQDHH